MSRPIRSHTREVLGNLGDHHLNGKVIKVGVVRPMFPDALLKCRCGATLRGRLDLIVHTSGTGVCVVRLRDGSRERCAL